MSYLKRYISTVSMVCLVGGLCVALPVYADGDPSESEPKEIAAKTNVSAETGNELRPDEQTAPAEEAVATITADGDFLLPTYLLPGETANIERTTTVEKIYEQPAAQPKVSPSRIQVAEPVRPVEQKQVVEQNDDLAELLRQTAPNNGRRQTVETSKKLLIPLAPVPVAEPAEPTLPAREKAIVHGEYADQMVGSLKSGEPLAFKMPHEMRITFYPKASAFSGQALKWIKGFALAAVEDPRLVVEVRASCAEARLQATRLKLVKEALRGAGLSTHQIVVNYTNRPVDTMLLRAVPRIEAEELVATPKDQKLPKHLSQVRKW